MLWDPAVHKNPPLLPILSQTEPVHALPFYLRSILISSTHLGPTGCLFSAVFPKKTLHAFLIFPQTCHMPGPSHTPWSYNTNIWWEVQIIKLAIMIVSILLGPNYLPQHLNVKHYTNIMVPVLWCWQHIRLLACWRRLKGKYRQNHSDLRQQ